MDLPIAVKPEDACLLKPRSLVGRHVRVNGEVGLVQAFHRVRMPGGGHSYHRVLFAHHDAARRVLLRRRKLGAWNPGEPFAVLRDPPRHVGAVVGPPAPAKDDEARLWMEAHHFRFDNPRLEGRASWSADDDEPLYVTPLAEACYQGRLDIAQWLVTSGGAKEDLEEPPDHSRTCMHFAAFGGQLEAMKWLCGKDKRAQAHAIDKCGQSTCHFAAMCELRHRGLEVLKFLLLQGCRAELEQPDHDGDTVMHTAVLHENIDICEWLLSVIGDKRDEIHFKNRHGQSAVDMALEEREMEVCRWLYELRSPACTQLEKSQLMRVIQHGR